MALPPSGAISFNDINVELGVAGTTEASLGQASYRTLAGVPSGAISMSNFYGKANQFAFTISSNQTNANLATLATAAGWNGTSKVVATIASGVYCSSNSTGTPGLTISGSFPGGVELINNGFIVGMGGRGGNGGTTSGGGGSAGGGALSVASAISITNNGTIGGGGGGGGGGGRGYAIFNETRNGGGGGGGRSGTTNSSGGSGASGASSGSPGTSSGGGGGGAGQSGEGGAGGTGGNWGSSGATGGTGRTNPGGDSGWPGGGGGSGGYAVSGNSNITWVATGTRLGSIS